MINYILRRQRARTARRRQRTTRNSNTRVTRRRIRRRSYQVATIWKLTDGTPKYEVWGKFNCKDIAIRSCDRDASVYNGTIFYVMHNGNIIHQSQR